MENWNQSVQEAIKGYLATPPINNEDAIAFAAWLTIMEKGNISVQRNHNDLLHCLESFRPKSQLESLCQQQIQSLMNYIDYMETNESDNANSCLDRYLKCLAESTKILIRAVEPQGKHKISQVLTDIQKMLGN